MRSATKITSTVGRWSTRHPWRAVAVWLLAVIAAAGIGMTVGSVQLTNGQQSSGEAGRATRIIETSFPEQVTQYVLLTSATTVATDPQFRDAVTDVITRLRATGHVSDVMSPLTPANSGLVSRDQHAAMVEYLVPGDMESAAKYLPSLDAAVVAARSAHPDIQMRQTGDVSINDAYDSTIGNDFKRAEQLSMPITLIVLLVAFGAVIAALLPLSLAVTAIIAANGLLAVVSHVSPISQIAGSLLLLIGLAVGVDYSMFYVKRAREERRRGRSPLEALDVASATSGRSVLVSGLTVLVAMAGTLLAGNGTFTAVAQATMLVVAVAVVGSLTVLPALLALLGPNVDRGRLPRLRRPNARRGSDHGEHRVWSAIVTRTLRHPGISAVLAAGALIALAVPALSMHTATPGASDFPHTAPALKTWDRIQAAFPGGPVPAQVVIRAADVTTPAMRQHIADLHQRAVATGLMREPVTTMTNRAGTVEVVSIPLAGSGDDPTSTRALGLLRHTVIPAIFGTGTATEVAVTGYTANVHDFNATLKARVPLVIAFVLVIAFLLLLVSFRSLVIALKAILLNLLSLAASYGVLVLVFQHRWAQDLLGFHSTGSIAAWVPLFLFTILFGLSMDYHVFILSRVREAHDRGDTTRDAVRHGITSTAGVVTAAAVVMVFVFLTFVTLSQVSLKQIGLGLAVAVLLDATIVRAVLLPATMTLLGEWNWYLPRWLQWLPQVTPADPEPHDGVTTSQRDDGRVPAGV